MRESTALGSALLAGHALGLFGWDLNDPSTLKDVNTADSQLFEPSITPARRRKMIRGWERAVSRARAWHEGDDELELEERELEIERDVGLEALSLAAGAAESVPEGALERSEEAALRKAVAGVARERA